MNRLAKIAAGAAAATSALGFKRARRRAQPQSRQSGEGAGRLPGARPAERGDATPKPPEDLAAERFKQRLDESRERLKAEIPPPE